MRRTVLCLLLSIALPALAERPRAADLGITVGILPRGPLNAITDVTGVLVGHTTIIRGENVRTGVTAVLPHGGNLFREKVPGAVFTGNGFGKLMGSTQVEELGEIESPILLTNTLAVGRVADFALDHLLALPGNAEVRSINIVVGETNDGRLNDIRGRHIGRDDVLNAIRGARGGEVGEGSVGAGTGTVAFGFKGGIGTASRRLAAALGGYTVGVLVQSNFGGVLTIAGKPVGKGLASLDGKDELGSIMIVVATDAPLDARNLRRMAARTMWGVARTGGSASNGSGDYAIAFSTVRDASAPRVRNDDMSPLFLAVIEATEEAIYNSLLKATTVTSAIGTAEAIPLGAIP
ncbi:MAG TPA: P1 family peptidase [Thermoanaerobaculia bacterium]|nr:P1 family peptidase [Thermoanaerobaculia bacterium]